MPSSMKCALIVCFAVAMLLKSSHGLTDAGCGTTKSCYRMPAGCSPSSSSCLFVSYTYNPTSQEFTFELSGGSGAGAQYAAMAFTSGAEMMNGDLYYCIGSELKSGSLGTRYALPTTTSALPTGVTSISANTANGVGECTFTRPASVTKTINSSPMTFNLATTNYYILLATGTYNGNLVQHTGANRYPSASALNFTTAPAPITTPQPNTATTQPSSDLTAGCGSTKGCFRTPAGCSTTSSSCMFVSWKYNQAQSTFDFEVSGGSAGAQYAAFAFAPSTRMENADLYYCTSSAVKSGAIQVNQQAPAVDATLPAGITSTQTGANGGAVQCSFTRAASITKDLLSANTVVDISSTQYFLLVATGPSTGSSIGYHGQNSRTASPSAIDFKLNEDIGGNTSSLKANLVKAHASLMIIAWLTCASIGVIIARHFKPLFHGRTCIKEKVWFQIHRSLMITAVLATMLAFILIFVSIEGYSANAGAHPIIGIIVTCLAITNPIMAVFRPHPDEKNRVIFNWAHWFVGTTAHILGITAIFLGVDLTRLNLPEWDTWVLVGFVVFHVVVEVILEILSAFYGHIAAYKKKPKNSMNMDGEPASKDPPPKGAGIKYFILVFYSLGNIGFMITFIVFIAMNE